MRKLASMEVDPNTLQLLIQHGRRKGYLTRKDILDCIHDAEYDEHLFDQVVEAVNEADITYVGENEEEEQGEETFDAESIDEVTETVLEPVIDDLQHIEADDMVRLYIKEAARVPLLTREEETELAQRIELCWFAQQELQRGHVSPRRLKELREIIEDGREARDRLIRSNARLVISVAKKYTGRGLPFLDLIQEGNIGLMRAIRNFDYHRGFKFSTYATWWIRQAVTRALAEQSRTIRLPVHMSDQANRMLREQSRLQQNLGRPPTTEELAEALQVPPEKVDQMRRIIRQPLSLQTTIGEDEEDELGDLIEDVEATNPEESTMEMLMNEDLRRRLEDLPPRERQVLLLRYGLGGEEPMTLNEAGRQMGITRERARQLEAQALNRLRNPAGKDKQARSSRFSERRE